MNRAFKMFPVLQKKSVTYVRKCAVVSFSDLFLSSGGVVVFAVNSLLYLNQSVPPYGVSLNSQTNGTTAFPLRKC